jgi:hypothetical protein
MPQPRDSETGALTLTATPERADPPSIRTVEKVPRRRPVTLTAVTTGGFGGALFLIALGAILRFAVDWEPAGVDIGIVGLILVIVGAVLLLLTLLVTFGGRRPPGTMPPGPPY